jgi:hypothetical protein
MVHFEVPRTFRGGNPIFSYSKQGLGQQQQTAENRSVELNGQIYDFKGGKNVNNTEQFFKKFYFDRNNKNMNWKRGINCWQCRWRN